MAFAYDANGNLTTETPPSPAPARSYVYDVENRLVGAPGSVVLTYDPLGRLYAVSSPTTDTRFLYDGDALVAEYNAAGTLLRRYVHDIGADVPAIQYEGTTVSAATRRYLLSGPQGSIVASTDGSSVIQSRNSYDEYGIPAATNTGRFQYTGQIWIPELGMYHYKARVYSPTLGRFLQTDPIGYQDQFNLYGYVGNDPVNLTDPTGMCARLASGCGGGDPYFGVVIGTDGSWFGASQPSPPPEPSVTAGGSQGSASATAQNSGAPAPPRCASTSLCAETITDRPGLLERRWVPPRGAQNGVAIQDVSIRGVLNSGRPFSRDFSEGWELMNGEWTDPGESGIDTFQALRGFRSVTVNATANFYRGMLMPGSMVPRGVDAAHELRASFQRPSITVPAVGPPVVITWSCEPCR